MSLKIHSLIYIYPVKLESKYYVTWFEIRLKIISKQTEIAQKCYFNHKWSKKYYFLAWGLIPHSLGTKITDAKIGIFVKVCIFSTIFLLQVKTTSYLNPFFLQTLIFSPFKDFDPC